MQLSAAAVALALLLCAAPASAARSGASVVAAAWLREHAAPQGDELAELKTANPEAYAIVKALLTKRSLGLLNPKHPSASFAAPAKPADDDSAASGPAAFQALASSSSSVATAAVYPEAPVAAAPRPHRDWLHWQPKQSAIDDEAMVNSVLGAVAELKQGGAHSKSLLSQGQGSTAQAATAAATAAPPSRSTASGMQASSPASTDNSYLKGLDLGSSNSPVVLPHTEDQENSYLSSVNLSPPKPKPSLRQHDSTDYLASFTWDDEPQKPAARGAARGHAPSSAAPAEQGAAQPQGAGTQAPQHGNALLAWLGGSTQGGPAKLSALAQTATTPAPEEHRNPYMSYLH